MPPTVNAAALAAAAPSTPQPIPNILNDKPNQLTFLVGYISRKLRTTLTIFTAIPTFIGVLVSPAARRTVPKIMLAVLGSIGRYSIKKYLDASDRILSSTCIHTGTLLLSPRVTAVKNVPTASVTSTACPTAFDADCLSSAPQDFAIKARKPMLKAEIELEISQFTVVVEPTAAVACVPSEPTIAVSIYCTAVCISCSSIVGQARAHITATVPQSICFFAFSTVFSSFLCKLQIYRFYCQYITIFRRKKLYEIKKPQTQFLL